jgi:benzoate transport
MKHIDLHKLADEARFSGFHRGVLLWCALIIIFDGYDLAVAGIALPSIMKQMGVSPTNAGFMVSSALFGMMFGAIFLGTIADRIGRRRAIAICIALFSVFTAAAGLTSDPVTFSVMRFLAGLGIGGVMPNVVAQMTEYAPRKMRSTLVTLMFSGYAVGGMLAAVVGKGLIVSYGWQSVFLAAGLPVLLIPVILKSMPESMPFLIKTRQTARLQELAGRLDPSYRPQPSDSFDLPQHDRDTSAPIGKLFQDGRGFSTVMFWIAFFMCLFMVYALSSWLTKLMAGAGYTLGSALTFVLVLNFGGMVGAIGPLPHQGRAGRHVPAGGGVDQLARVSRAHVGALRAGRLGWRLHHRHANRHLRLCGPVLPDGGALHRHRLGLGRGAQRCHPGAHRDRQPGGDGAAAGDELSGHRLASTDRGGGRVLHQPQPRCASAQRRPCRACGGTGHACGRRQVTPPRRHTAPLALKDSLP